MGNCETCKYQDKTCVEYPCNVCLHNYIDKYEQIEFCIYCETQVIQNINEDSTVFELGYNYCPKCGRELS